MPHLHTLHLRLKSTGVDGQHGTSEHTMFSHRANMDDGRKAEMKMPNMLSVQL